MNLFHFFDSFSKLFACLQNKRNTCTILIVYVQTVTPLQDKRRTGLSLSSIRFFNTPLDAEIWTSSCFIFDGIFLHSVSTKGVKKDIYLLIHAFNQFDLFFGVQQTLWKLDYTVDQFYVSSSLSSCRFVWKDMSNEHVSSGEAVALSVHRAVILAMLHKSNSRWNTWLVPDKSSFFDAQNWF